MLILQEAALTHLFCHVDDFCQTFQPHLAAHSLLLVNDCGACGEIVNLTLTTGEVHDIRQAVY